MRQEIITNIDNIVDSYNQKISETLNIDKKILDKIWEGRRSVAYRRCSNRHRQPRQKKKRMKKLKRIVVWMKRS